MHSFAYYVFSTPLSPFSFPINMSFPSPFTLHLPPLFSFSHAFFCFLSTDYHIFHSSFHYPPSSQFLFISNSFAFSLPIVTYITPFLLFSLPPAFFTLSHILLLPLFQLPYPSFLPSFLVLRLPLPSTFFSSQIFLFLFLLSCLSLHLSKFSLPPTFFSSYSFFCILSFYGHVYLSCFINSLLVLLFSPAHTLFAPYRLTCHSFLFSSSLSPPTSQTFLLLLLRLAYLSHFLSFFFSSFCFFLHLTHSFTSSYPVPISFLPQFILPPIFSSFQIFFCLIERITMSFLPSSTFQASSLFFSISDILLHPLILLLCLSLLFWQFSLHATILFLSHILCFY